MSDASWLQSEFNVAPPQDQNAEKAVLGAVLLLGPDLVSKLIDLGLEAGDFYLRPHGVVFEAMVSLHNDGAGVDHLTVEDELRRTGRLEEIGGPVAVEVLSGACPDAANALDYARVIRRTAFLRRRRDAALYVLENPSNEDRWSEFVQVAEAPFDSDGNDRRKLDLAKTIALADVKPPWRCGELAADGHVTVLVGRGGEGKSLLALALAGAVQLGQTLAGIETKRGRVVIFDAENGPWVTGDRLRSAGTPLTNLEIYDAEGLDLNRHRAWFTSCAEGANLVIFDSIRTLAPGSKENDSDDMAPIMASIRHVARKTGAAVIAIHHRGKGDGDYRGSSAMRDQTDMMFVLERADRDPDARRRRALRCVKCRIAEEPATKWIVISRHRGELYLQEAAPYEPEESARPARDELEEQLLGVIADKGPVTRGELAEVLGRTRKDGTVRRALQELVEDGMAVKIAGHRYILASGANPPLAPVGTPGPLTLDDAAEDGGVPGCQGATP
jgi:hypothetical protein